MSYYSYCRVLFFYFILFEKSHLYNAEYSKTSDNKSETIPKHISNGTFTIFFKKSTWLDAVSFCNGNGMKIGEVKTMNDARSLSEMMLNNRSNSIESAWIGGVINSTNRKESVWRWQSTNEPIVNNSGLWFRQTQLESKSDSESESKESQCLLLDWHLDNQNNPAYVKAPCDREREFICEQWGVVEGRWKNADKSVNADFSKFMIPTPDIIPPNVLSKYRTQTKPTSKIKSSGTVDKIKKRKKQKLKGITKHSSTSTTTTTTTTTTSTTTVRTTTEEEYPDYKMWELGKKQMGGRRNQIAKEIQNETSENVSRRYYEYLRQLQDLKNLITTHKSETKPQSTLMPLKPLRLYYAFEGPMVGGLTVTPLPHDEFDGEIKVASGPRYHKYISRQKYHELISKKPSKPN